MEKPRADGGDKTRADEPERPDKGRETKTDSDKLQIPTREEHPSEGSTKIHGDKLENPANE